MLRIQKYQRNRIAFVTVFLVVGTVVFLMTQCIIPGFKCKDKITFVGPQPVTLDVWNVFEDKDIYREIISKYRESNGYVTVNYETIQFEEYRAKLIEAFAAGKGPDIFVIHNTWLHTQKDRIAPAPSDMIISSEFDSIFPDVVKFDFVRMAEDGGRFVYAVPLAIETLGLFYNKDYFDAENIEVSPKLWDEVVDFSRLFTRFDERGDIKISGISLGAIANINRSTDIVGLLMMQGGARMNNESLTEATFDETVITEAGDLKKEFKPGKDAVDFYLSFSDERKPVYSWNEKMSYSIDAFVEGKSVMMINYPHHIQTIKRKAPHLNFSTGPAPQLKDRKEDVNYANYWGFTVAKNSDAVKEAWRFIDFLASPDAVKLYVEKTKLPVARKDLVLWQQQDEELKHFSSQILTAKSWYQGDSDAAEAVLGEMVESAKSGKKSIEKAIEDAAAQISIIIKRIRSDQEI